jgi:hypothetical protein
MGKNILPACISSGDGNIVMMTKAKADTEVDKVLRAACIEMGWDLLNRHEAIQAECYAEPTLAKPIVR